MNWRNRQRDVASQLQGKAGLPLAVAIGLAVLVAGCTTTVAPRPVESRQASWDGSEQNSGVVELRPDHSAVITSRARDRYNGLIELYGKRFVPALKADEGVEPLRALPTGQSATQQAGQPALQGEAGRLYRIDAEHLVKFATMNRWRKEGVK